MHETKRAVGASLGSGFASTVLLALNSARGSSGTTSGTTSGKASGSSAPLVDSGKSKGGGGGGGKSADKSVGELEDVTAVRVKSCPILGFYFTALKERVSVKG